ncbi:MAG: nucleoside deaminase [Opitutales bacterium]
MPPCPFSKRFPSQLLRDETFFLQLAFNQAIDAWHADEVPVGAVVEYGGEPVGLAHNQVNTLRDPTAHAEMLALTQAATAVGDWRLNACTLYVTKEPCPMCAGAAIMARCGQVVYAVSDPKMGFLGGAESVHLSPGLNHRLTVRQGPLEDDCRALLQAYFQLKRE